MAEIHGSNSLVHSVICKLLLKQSDSFDGAEFVGNLIDDLVPFTPKDLAELFVAASMMKSTLQWEANDRKSNGRCAPKTS